MRTRIAATIALAGFTVAVTGCVSLKRTPDARFFVLQSEIQPGSTPSGQTPQGIVGVEKVFLPGYLVRAELVTWTTSNELAVDEFLRWAEPLEDGIARTLSEDLAALLPEYQIIRHPWRGDTTTRCRVDVVLEVFGLQRDGKVMLEGRFRLLPDEGELALVQQTVKLERGPLTGKGSSEVMTGIDAMNELIADLSRQIAAAIQALPPPREPPEEEEEESVAREEMEKG